MSDKLQKSPLAVVFNIVLAVALVLFIISAAVVFTLNFRPLYYFDVDHLNITAMSGLPREEILQNYNVLIDYNSIFGTKVLNFPTLAMTRAAASILKKSKTCSASSRSRSSSAAF